MRTINHYTDLANAEKYAKDYDAIISLGHKLPEKSRANKKYLFLDFEDVTYDILQTTPQEDVYAPNKRHVQELLKFIRGLSPSDRLLVHCFAGYSRSPAVTAIAETERDGTPLEHSIEHLPQNRIPDKLIPKPNDIILDMYERIKNEENRS